MSFPASPVDGQIEVINNISYRWSDALTAWVRVALTSVNTLTANQVNVLGTTNTTGTDTGAVVVAGGVGIAKDLNVGGSLGLQETLRLTTGTSVSILGTIDTAGNLSTAYPSPNLYEAYVALDDNTLRVWDGANWVLYGDLATTYQDVNRQYTRASRTYTNKDIIYNGVTIDQFIPGDFYYDDGINNPGGDGYPHLYLYYDTGLGYTNLLDLLPPTIQ